LFIALRQGRHRRDAIAAGEEKNGRCAAGMSKYYRLRMGSGKLVLAAVYLRRVRVIGRSYAAAPANVSTFFSRQLLRVLYCFFLKLSGQGED
jgi:hypothetical protein